MYFLRDRIENCRIDNAFIIGDAASLATVDLGEGIGPAVESGFRAADSIINKTKFSLHSIHKRNDPVALRTLFFIWRIINFFRIKRPSKLSVRSVEN